MNGKVSPALRGVYRSVIALILAVSVSLVGSSSAAAQDFTADRSLVIGLLDSPLPTVAAGAQMALRTGNTEVVRFAREGYEHALITDYGLILASMSRALGPRASTRARELSASGNIADIEHFIETAWQEFQREDDRDLARRLSAGDPDDVVTQWAEEALELDQAGDGAALSDFAATGYYEASVHDMRRKLYELAAQDGQAVAGGASAALASNSVEVFEQYLSFGQFADAIIDQEYQDVLAVSDNVVQQAQLAVERYHEAAFQGEIAAEAAAAARIAAERARDHSQNAQRHSEEAARAAQQAGELALLAGKAADDAVASANEAHEAMLMTSQAMNRAASALAGASGHSAKAYQLAASASGHAATAAEGRKAAEQAAQSARAATKLREISRFVSNAESSASHAATAAQQAGEDARSAASAAEESARFAAGSATAARQAQTGAATARAAADRAFGAAQRVRGFVERVRHQVDAVQRSADAASNEAAKAAVAASEAFNHAGDARTAAEKAQDYADSSRVAADAAATYRQLAVEISDAARSEYDALFAAETKARSAEALEAAKAEQERQSNYNPKPGWQEAVRMLLPAGYPDTSTNSQWQTLSAEQLTDAFIDIAASGPSLLAAAAQRGLLIGSVEDMEHVRRGSLVSAMDQYQRNQVNFWAENGSGELAEKALSASSGTVHDVNHFVENTVRDHQRELLRQDIVTIVTSFEAQDRLLSEAGADPIYENVILAGREVSAGGDIDRMYSWLNHDIIDDLALDGRITAYNSLDIYGPFSRMEAEVAIHGPPSYLLSYLSAYRPQALIQDELHAVVRAHIDATHERNNRLVALAEESAAYAQAEAAQARQAADEAYGHQAQAQEYRETADLAAAEAHRQLGIAREHLAVAQQHQARAVDASQRARNDASAATTFAATAVNHASEAQIHADQARIYSYQASDAALNAQGDAQAAAVAAESARSYMAQQLAERDPLISVAEPGLHQDHTVGVANIVLDYVKENGVDLVLELTGISDILGCAQGEFNACMWLVVGALPPGKVVKAAGFIRKLVADLPGIIKAHKSHRAGALGDAGDACSLGAAFRASASCQLLRNTGKSADVERQGGRVYHVNGANLKEKEDFEAVVHWHPATGLEDPHKVVYRGTRVYLRRMEPAEAERLRRLVTETDRDGVKLLEKVTVSDQAATHADEVADIRRSYGDSVTQRPAELPQPAAQLPVEVMQAKIGPEDVFSARRSIGTDSPQNIFVNTLGIYHSVLSEGRVAVNQTLMGFNKFVAKITGKRPDLQIGPSSFERKNLGPVFYEFDRKSSNRALDHAGSALYANPDAAVVMFTFEDALFDDKARRAMAEVISDSLNQVRVFKEENVSVGEIPVSNAVKWNGWDADSSDRRSSGRLLW